MHILDGRVRARLPSHPSRSRRPAGRTSDSGGSRLTRHPNFGLEMRETAGVSGSGRRNSPHPHLPHAARSDDRPEASPLPAGCSMPDPIDLALKRARIARRPDRAASVPNADPSLPPPGIDRRTHVRDAPNQPTTDAPQDEFAAPVASCRLPPRTVGRPRSTDSAPSARQRPSNAAGRLSRNATTPSLKSRVAPHRPCSRASSASCPSRSLLQLRRDRRLSPA